MHIKIYKEVLIKEHDILKKPYLAPRVAFEEIEEDELDMLMMSTDDAEREKPGSGPGQGDRPRGSTSSSLDVDFDVVGYENSTDFVINDE